MALDFYMGLNRYDPEPKQMLPKDILSEIKDIKGTDAERHIIEAVRNHKASTHSHQNDTYNPAFGGQTQPNPVFGNTSSTVWPTFGAFTTTAQSTVYWR